MFWLKYDSTHISVILFLRAGLNSFFPKSPEGFIVATMLNYEWAIILIASLELFSERVKVLYFSNTEFNLSRTESLAKDISSINSNPPFYMDSTNIPSFHSNTIFNSFCSFFIYLYFSFTSLLSLLLLDFNIFKRI